MNLTTLMQIGENINENSTLADRALVGVQVVAIGMGVVFGVLLILICILQAFKMFASEKPAKKEADAPVVASAPVVTPAPVSSAQAVSGTDSEEATVVAIATAAIAASRGESEAAFKVLSIKKIVK